MPQALRLPWRFEMLSGVTSERGKTTPPVARIVGAPLMISERFPEDNYTCIYQAPSVAGSYNTGGALQITLAEQKLTRVKSPLENEQECPSETKVNGHLAVTSGGEEVKAEL